MPKPSPLLLALVFLSALVSAFAWDPFANWAKASSEAAATRPENAKGSLHPSASQRGTTAAVPQSAVKRAQSTAWPARIATERGTGLVTGQVLSFDNRPVVGAQISLLAITSPKLHRDDADPSESEQLADDLRWREAHQFQTLTDGTGSYRFDDLPGDVFYRMEATAPGYVLKTRGPSEELIPPAELLWIAEPAKPLSHRLIDEQGVLMTAARIRYRPFGIEVPIRVEKLPSLNAGSDVKEFPWTPRHQEPLLRTSWYVLQAESLDAALQSEVFLHFHQAESAQPPREVVLRGGAPVRVRLESAPPAGLHLKDLAVAQVAVPESLPESALNSFLNDTLFGNSGSALQRLSVGKERDLELLRVPRGRNAILLLHELTILDQRILNIESEDHLVTLNARGLPEPKLRTIHIDGVSKDELASITVRLDFQQRPHQDLQIYDIQGPSLRVYEPDEGSIFRSDGYSLVGAHPRLGVAENLLEQDPMTPWRLRFGPRSDLQLIFRTPSPHPDYEATLECELHNPQFQSKIKRVLSADNDPVLSNLPRDPLSVRMRANVVSRNRNLTDLSLEGVAYISGKLPVSSFEIALTEPRADHECSWPEGGPLTISGWSAMDPKPPAIILTHADGEAEGLFEVFLPREFDGDIEIPWLPSGPWKCSPSADREVIHHQSASRIALAPNRIMGWRISNAPKDSHYVRSGGQSGDILLAWDGHPAPLIWQAIQSAEGDKPLGEAEILREGRRLLIKGSNRLAAQSHWPIDFLGCHIEPVMTLPMR